MQQTVCEVGACSRLATLCVSGNQTPGTERATSVSEDPSLSVLPILPKWRRRCDTLVVNVSYASAVRRQAVLTDLSNILQLLKGHGTVVFNGSAEDECDGKGSVTVRGMSAVLAERRRRKSRDCPKSTPRVQCAPRGSWCDYWRRYVAAGFFREARCQPHGHSCVARVNLSSSCDRPALARARGEPIHVESKHPKSWRYFSATPCEERGVCLFFKDATYESYLAGMRSEDGLHFSKPRLVMPARWQARMTHNTAILADNSTFTLVGGRHRWRTRGGGYGQDRGVWMTSGRDWWFGRGKSRWRSNATNWQPPKLLFNGTHPGCTERRNAVRMPWVSPDNACEFDGRMSLVKFKRKYLLYVRANAGARGMRFVQVTESTLARTSFGPFRLIRLEGYAPTQGEIYFFAVQTHPMNPNILLALFPIVHAFCGCIAVAFSTDGVRWTAPFPLLRADVIGDRTVDHPVAGLVRRGERMYLYLHRNVQNIAADNEIGSGTLLHMRRFERKTAVVRYVLSKRALWNWTVRALETHDYQTVLPTNFKSLRDISDVSNAGTLRQGA